MKVPLDHFEQMQRNAVLGPINELLSKHDEKEESNTAFKQDRAQLLLDLEQIAGEAFDSAFVKQLTSLFQHSAWYAANTYVRRASTKFFSPRHDGRKDLEDYEGCLRHLLCDITDSKYNRAQIAVKFVKLLADFSKAYSEQVAAEKGLEAGRVQDANGAIRQFVAARERHDQAVREIKLLLSEPPHRQPLADTTNTKAFAEPLTDLDGPMSKSKKPLSGAGKLHEPQEEVCEVEEDGAGSAGGGGSGGGLYITTHDANTDANRLLDEGTDEATDSLSLLLGTELTADAMEEAGATSETPAPAEAAAAEKAVAEKVAAEAAAAEAAAAEVAAEKAAAEQAAAEQAATEAAAAEAVAAEVAPKRATIAFQSVVRFLSPLLTCIRGNFFMLARFLGAFICVTLPYVIPNGSGPVAAFMAFLLNTVPGVLIMGAVGTQLGSRVYDDPGLRPTFGSFDRFVWGRNVVINLAWRLVRAVVSTVLAVLAAEGLFRELMPIMALALTVFSSLPFLLLKSVSSTMINMYACNFADPSACEQLVFGVKLFTFFLEMALATVIGFAGQLLYCTSGGQGNMFDVWFKVPHEQAIMNERHDIPRERAIVLSPIAQRRMARIAGNEEYR